MKTIEALYEDGLLKPETPLSLKSGERVRLIVVRHPDPRRWDLDRLAKGADEDLALAEQGGEERIILLDALDYRLLQALALCATGERDKGDLLEARVLRGYLDEKISLGKAAELLQLTRFELEASFQRLEIPLRRGARSVEDAQAEIAAARRHA